MERTLVLRFDTRLLVLVGALVVMAAVALPWANLPSFIAGDLARGGVAGGGLFTLALAIVAAASLLLPRYPLGRISLPAVILALLIYLVAIAAFIRVIQLASGLELGLGAQLGSLGSGLYLTFAGALLMIAGGLSGIAPAEEEEEFDDLLDPAPPNVRQRRWLAYGAWLGLGTALLAGCLCAWGVGLVTRPVTLSAAGGLMTPTFAPAPTAYLATPLVGVQLAPLGGSPVASPSILATPTRVQATQAPSPTRQPATAPPTATQRPTTAPNPTATIPTLSGQTSTPAGPTSTPTVAASPTLSSPLATPTVTSSPTATTAP